MAKVKKSTYVLTRAIRGAEKKEVGSAVELTEDQAASAFYRNRCRKADGLTVADAPASSSADTGSQGANGSSGEGAPTGSDAVASTDTGSGAAASADTAATWKQPAAAKKEK